MKILQLTKYFSPSVGGIETVTLELSAGLVAQGNSVRVIAFSEGKETSRDNVTGIDVFRAGTIIKVAGQPFSLKYLKEIFSSMRWADVIHLHGPNPLVELFILAVLFTRKNVPVLYTHHSDIVEQRILGPIYRPFQKVLLSKVKAIAVATPFHLHYSTLLSRLSSKIKVIPFGISEVPYQAYQSNPGAFEKAHLAPYFLFVGRLVKYKGLSFLIQAMKNVPANLIIVGSGPLQKRLESQSRNLNLNSKIHFVGSINDQSQLIALYSHAAAIVLPSISANEAFGMVLLEAMVCHKPMVTTALKSGVQFVNIDGQTGLVVPPMDSISLTDALNALIQSPGKAKQMGSESYSRYLKLFTASSMVDAYVNLYRSIQQHP